jgi:uncharacterized protein (DUF885 family)
MHILTLRKEIEKKLGKKFSLKQFHDAVLAHGPLPLHILSDQVRKTLIH